MNERSKQMARWKKRLAAILLLIVVVTTGLVFTVIRSDDVVQAAEVIIHFKWSGDIPHLYYENVNGSRQATMNYPGVPMKDEGNGWYTYTIADANSADITLSIPTKDYQSTSANRENGEWWFDGLHWYTENPDAGIAVAEDSKNAGTAQDAQNNSSKEKEVISLSSQVNAAENKVTVHCYSENDIPNLYYWNALPEDIETPWPGVTMTKEKENWYSYEIPDISKVNVLFNIGSTQTEDLTAKAGEWWYKNGKWSKKDLSSTTVNPTPVQGDHNDFREESIYFIMTARFYDGDSSNNIHSDHDAEVGNGDNDPAWRGDFKGLIEKLDYIKALGFSAVWITPVVENASGYDFHGYHAVNFAKVDPRLESDGASYQDLINEAHKRGMKIIQDIVLQHTSNSGEEELFPMVDREYTLDKGASGNSVTTTPKDSARSKLNEFMSIVSNGKFNDYDAALSDTQNGPSYQYQSRDQWMKSDDMIYRKKVDIGWEDFTVTTGQFAGDCMELNTELPTVYNYLLDTYGNYINMGVDAFRIDTVKHISRLTMNEVFIPGFLEKAKAAGNDNFYMYAEVACRTNEFINHGVHQVSPFYYTWKSAKSYTWNHNSIDGKDNLETCRQEYNDGKSGSVEYNKYNNARLNGNEYHTPDHSEYSGMGVIDYGMHFSFEYASKAFDTGKAEDDYMNDSTYNVVYVDSHDYGPGMNGKNDQDGNDLWRYDGGPEAWAENMNLMFTFRGIPCIYYGSEVEFKAGLRIDNYHKPLEETGRAYFGDYLEGEVTATDFSKYTASGAVADTLNKPLAKHLQRLNMIRRSVPALQKGQYSTEDVNGGMAFKRRYTDSDTDSFVCVAITDGATFNNLPGGTYTDAITGDTQTISEGGSLTISAPGKGNMRVYVLDTNLTDAPGKVGEAGTYLK